MISGIGPGDAIERPSYREAVFPPPQHDALGRLTPPPSIDGRPSYRRTANAFPPPGGRYGGGIEEYVMTGGRPEPVDPRVVPYPSRIRIAPVTVAPVTVAAASLAADPAAAYDPSVPYYPSTPGILGAGVGLPSSEPVVAPSPLRAALPAGGLPDYGAAIGTPVAAAPQVYGQVGYGQVGYGRGGYAAGEDRADLQRAPDPAFARQTVAYSGNERAGTVIIDTPNKYLYLVQPGGNAIRYGIGVGRPGFMWSGVKRISRKATWPGWTPPSQMIARRPDLPRHMEGGLANPLGARALYLGSSLYRIHGTNEPWTIGQNVSSGCIRMMNADVEDLYDRVPVGAKVVVL